MERKISEHIKNRYKLVGIQAGVMIIKGKRYDFQTISKKAADELYADGCQYLAPVSDKVKEELDKELKASGKESPKPARNAVRNGDELLKLKTKKKPEKPANQSGPSA